MNQSEIRVEKERLKEKILKFKHKYKLKEDKIRFKMDELTRNCTHPNKQGCREGYCPDCFYMFG